MGCKRWEREWAVKGVGRGCKRCGREWAVKGGGGNGEGKAVNAEQARDCHTRHVRSQSFKRSLTHRHTDATLCMWNKYLLVAVKQRVAFAENWHVVLSYVPDVPVAWPLCWGSVHAKQVKPLTVSFFFCCHCAVTVCTLATEVKNLIRNFEKLSCGFPLNRRR